MRIIIFLCKFEELKISILFLPSILTLKATFKS